MFLGALAIGLIVLYQLKPVAVNNKPKQSTKTASLKSEVVQVAEVAPIQQDVGVVIHDRGAMFTMVQSSNTRPAVVPESQIRK